MLGNNTFNHDAACHNFFQHIYRYLFTKYTCTLLKDKSLLQIYYNVVSTCNNLMNLKFKHLESSSEYILTSIDLEYLQTNKNVTLHVLQLNSSLLINIITTLTSVKNLLAGKCAGMVKKLSSLITLYVYIIDGQYIMDVIIIPYMYHIE